MWISTWKQASLYYANRIPFIELSAFPFSVPSNPTQPNPTQLANLVKNKTTQSSNGKSVQSAAGSIARSLVLESDDDNWVDFGFCANFVQVHVEIYPAVVPVCKNLLGKTARLDFPAIPRQRHQKSVHQAQQHFFSLQSIENLYPKFILTQPKCRNSPITLFNFHIEIGLSVIIKEAEN